MEPAVTGMDAILAQITQVTTVSGDVFGIISGNAYLAYSTPF